MNKSKFLVIEGSEGVGKGLQLSKIVEYLSSKGVQFVQTREPGGTEVAEKIRDIIVNDNIDGLTEAYLFASARRDHVENRIKPALMEGKTVICDRFVYSSIAYQGNARGLGMDFIRKLNEPAVDGCYPDLVLYLDLDPEIGLKRIADNNRETNRLDDEKIEFYHKVREGFLTITKQEPDRFSIINADQTPEDVFNDIKKVLDTLF